MLTWFNCYLSGRHEFSVGCEPGAIFLRCVHCGRRSSGWSLGDKTPSVPLAARATATSSVVTAVAAATGVTAAAPGRVLPFGRAAS
jgi:hypothetical protein